jgi:hypothetical protein
MRIAENTEDMIMLIDAVSHVFHPSPSMVLNGGTAQRCQEWSVEVCEETTREIHLV